MKIRSLILAAMMAMTMSHTVFAYETEVINNIGIGDISISLAEFEVDENGQEVPGSAINKMVIPGQKIDKIVRVTNEAREAWVRAKVNFTSEDGLSGLDNSLVNLSSNKWKSYGEYFYYMTPLLEDETIDFMDSFHIPPYWTEKEASKEFSLVINVDAVQKENFKPDFESVDPWFGTVIETCVHTAYEKPVVETAEFQVEFKGGSEGLIKIGDDFFGNWGHLMPGDTVSDTVSIKNSYQSPVEIYFSTETISENELASKVHLTIKNGEKTIFDGTLKESVKEVLIASLKKSETAELEYTVHIPAELTNAFAMSETNTKWTFRCKVKSGGSQSSDDDDDYESNKGSSGSETRPSDLITDSDWTSEETEEEFWLNVLPMTGDTAMVGSAALLLILALVGVGVMEKKKRGVSKNDE